MHERQVGGVLPEDINRRSMVSSRASAACKYTRTEDSKISILTFCRYKKDLAVHVQMDNQAALTYLVKWERQETYLRFRRQRKYGNFVQRIRSHLLQSTCRGLEIVFRQANG